jgi:hypothetical protein
LDSFTDSLLIVNTNWAATDQPETSGAQSVPWLAYLERNIMLLRFQILRGVDLKATNQALARLARFVKT